MFGGVPTTSGPGPIHTIPRGGAVGTGSPMDASPRLGALDVTDPVLGPSGRSHELPVVMATTATAAKRPEEITDRVARPAHADQVPSFSVAAPYARSSANVRHA